MRALYILDSLKNYTLIILDVSYPAYLVSSLAANSVYILKNVLIGYQMTAINDLMNDRKNWDELDFTEKMFFVVVVALIGFTFVATGVFSWWARGKMNGKSIIIESEKRKIKRQHGDVELQTMSGSRV